MKIFYKYNGFTRSSELSTNFNGDYNTNYALLGSFDEDLWNLFGIFYVSESWSGESLEYVIEGFNEEGNGKTAPYEGETFEILREMFGGIWNDVRSQEDFEALFKPQVERLTIKIVPNPELANDKDDIYTYLNPENRDILSCSKVLIVPIPKEEEIPPIPDNYSVTLNTRSGFTNRPIGNFLLEVNGTTYQETTGPLGLEYYINNIEEVSNLLNIYYSSEGTFTIGTNVSEDRTFVKLKPLGDQSDFTNTFLDGIGYVSETDGSLYFILYREAE